MRQSEHRRGRRTASHLLIALAVAMAMLGVGTSPVHADPNPVEGEYSMEGQYTSVIYDENGDFTNDDCDINVEPNPTNPGYTVVYPEELAGDHPVVAWANGSNPWNPNPTCFYEPLFKHLASWGYVVIALNDGQTGSGQEILSAAGQALMWNLDPLSPFSGKLDTDHIAAAGHSQGAVGAINAANDDQVGLIDSVLALSMPDQDWIDFTYAVDLCEILFGEDCEELTIPDDATDQLDVPIFFARGTGMDNSGCRVDDEFSDETHRSASLDGWKPTENPSPVPYVFGTVKVDPPAGDPPFWCNLAGNAWPYPHLDLSNAFGYITAWLEYMRGCDGSSENAFTGAAPEINQNSNWDPDWPGQHSPLLNNLPTCP